MNGFVGHIEKLTLENKDYRRVLFTGKHSQLVVMTLQPKHEIGEEVHDTHDQFFRIEAGECTIIMDGKHFALKDGMAAIVPAGIKHNVINSSSEKELKLYTIYSPAEHPPGTVHRTKADAEKAHH